MILPREYDHVGTMKSPGGFEFGLQGWTPPEQRVSGLTFFLNGTAMVCDQLGQPIRGTVKASGSPVFFAMMPPQQDDKNPGYRQSIDGNGKRVMVKLATHAEVVAALGEERIEWSTLTFAGFPQLAYEELKKLARLPSWPFSDVHDPNSPVGLSCTCVTCSIRDPKLRKDAIRVRREVNDSREREVQTAMAETEE